MFCSYVARETYYSQEYIAPAIIINVALGLDLSNGPNTKPFEVFSKISYARNTLSRSKVAKIILLISFMLIFL